MSLSGTNRAIIFLLYKALWFCSGRQKLYKRQNGDGKLYDLSVFALRRMSNILRGLKSGRVLYAFAVSTSQFEIDFVQDNPESPCDLRIQASLKRLV